MNKIEYDELGNIIGLDIPEYNIITEDDDITVAEAKKNAQLKLLEDNTDNNN